MLPVVAGVSHRTAPVALRDRLALDGEGAAALAREVLDTGVGCEALALATCNRTEVYLYAREAGAARQAVLTALARRAGLDPPAVEPALYCHAGEGAVRHLFRVAASLDSMVVGEAQILHQIKETLAVARDAGLASAVLDRLFRHALEAGKRVRSETAIGARPVSVSSVAVDLALQVFGRLAGRRALVVGAGETAELTARLLREQGVAEVVVANRTLASAEEVARRVGGRAVPFDSLAEQLATADVVVSSTAAPHHVITRELAERALRHRRQPLFLIDIAVPRDVEPAVGELRQAYLFDIDDLQRVVAENREGRAREAQAAEAIVDEEVAQAAAWLRALEVVPTVTTLREAVERIRSEELDRLRGRLGDLTAEQWAQVEYLTTSIVNKILHLPTVRMKELAGQDQCYLYAAAVRELFGLGAEDGGRGASAAGGQPRGVPGTGDAAGQEAQR